MGKWSGEWNIGNGSGTKNIPGIKSAHTRSLRDEEREEDERESFH